MDIVEKETIKEVPVEYWHKSYGCGTPYGYGCGNSWGNTWGRPFTPASRGVAGAALGIGIGAFCYFGVHGNGFTI